MAERSSDTGTLEVAAARLDDELSHLRQATIRASQVEFGPVDLTATASGSAVQEIDARRELETRLRALMDEWHEDNGWAVDMPEYVRADLIERVRASVDDDIARGRLK